MDGNGLRKRKSKELHKDHNHQNGHSDYNDYSDDKQLCAEKIKNKKICGRTPDGTSESIPVSRLPLPGDRADEPIRGLSAEQCLLNSDPMMADFGL